MRHRFCSDSRTEDPIACRRACGCRYHGLMRKPARRSALTHCFTTLFGVGVGLLPFLPAFLRSHSALVAENLFLRKQLAFSGIPACPQVRPIQSSAARHKIPGSVRVAAQPVLGGLHHEYRLETIAA